MKLNVIYNEDCIGKKGMKILPNNSIDLIIAYSPYGINYKRGYKHDNKSIIGDTGFEVMVFLDDILIEFERVLKMNSAVYWFTRFDVYPYVFIKFRRYFQVKNQVIWHKKIETTGLGDRKGNYANNKESILFVVKGRHILREKICGSVWSIKPCKNKFHYTQKPLEIIEKIIRYSSDKNDIVLDPFIGGGTTAIACKRLNRRYIGFEINRNCYKRAEERLEAEKTLWD